MKYKTMSTRLYQSFFLIALIVATAAFSSCESYRTVEFVVQDADTHQPIDSVFVHVKAGKSGDYEKSGAEGYTNSTGFFSGSFMIGCSFGCYDIYVECSKSGYKQYVSEMNEFADTIRLVRE